MDIYIVQKGDTIQSIADKFGSTVEKLIKDNEITNPGDLVIGQNIIITYPEKTYVVKEGDTLESISKEFSIPLMQLLRNNPYLASREKIVPGETLVISYKTDRKAITHGFAYPYIQKSTLIETLPNLTYLTIFNYTSTPEGEMISFGDDTETVKIAKDFCVIPLMFITLFSNLGKPNKEGVFKLLSSEENQNKLLEKIILNIKNKGYMGINVMMNYLNTSNQHIYIEFLKKFSTAMKDNGYYFFVTINPNIENVNGDILFEKVDYKAISELVDHIIFLQFLWGTNYNPPSPVTSIKNLNAFLEYVTKYIPIEKTSIGIPIIGYDWILPFEQDKSQAYSLTVFSALGLARQHNSTINFDQVSQTPYFYYNESLVGGPPIQHIVWYVNAMSFNNLTKLVDDFNLAGTGIWNVMIYITQLWTLLNAKYEVIKLIPDCEFNYPE